MLCHNLFGKKDACNYGRPAWNFPSVHRCRNQLNRPFGFRKGTDHYAGKNDLYSLKATQQKLLGDACCPQREFILFVNYI